MKTRRPHYSSLSDKLLLSSTAEVGLALQCTASDDAHFNDDDDVFDEYEKVWYFVFDEYEKKVELQCTCDEIILQQSPKIITRMKWKIFFANYKLTKCFPQKKFVHYNFWKYRETNLWFIISEYLKSKLPTVSSACS